MSARGNCYSGNGALLRSLLRRMKKEADLLAACDGRLLAPA
jgi:hypothetical protein